MKIKKYIVLILLFISVSCTKKSETTVYFENSTQLMTQLLFENTDSDLCNCIVNLNQNVIENIIEERPAENIDKIKEELSQELNFKSKNLLERSLYLSESFQLKDVKTKKGKIIQRKQWDSLLKKSYEDYGKGLTESKFSIIDSVCNMKVCFITKPVFNKDYTIAAVYLDKMYGLSPTWYSIYEKKNEEWILFSN